MKKMNLMRITFILVLVSFTNVMAQSSKYMDEINDLANNPIIKKAFQYIVDTEDLRIKSLIQLTETPAPPFAETERSKLYADMMKKAGADEVYIDEAGNAIALRRGTKGLRTIVFEGHLDTVFPAGTDVTVKIDGDKLSAPGIGDDTAGLAVVLTVLRAMEDAGIETEANVMFVGTVGEEGLGDLKGVKHILRDGGPKVDSWIAVDGGGLDRIVNKGLGSHRYRITFKGKGGHSWGAFGIAHPHHALGRAMALFSDRAEEFTKTGPRTSYSVGMIGGGTSINSIPYESWMEIDMRSESPESLNKVDAILQKAVQDALKEQNAMRRRGEEMIVEVKMVGDRPSGDLGDNFPLVQRAMASSKFFNKKPKLSVSSTNANLPISKGIPAITIGRGGNGGNGHNLKEYWHIKDSYKAVQNALLIVIAEAGLGTKVNK